MSEFKVGDRVRLTGEAWSFLGGGGLEGTIQTIRGDDPDGDWYFELGDGRTFFVMPVEGYGAEPVPDDECCGGSCGLETEQEQEDRVEDDFATQVRIQVAEIADLLITKNIAYGDSALNPVRVFSKADTVEQLKVRIDDKISRIQRGAEFEDEDTELDLIGYLVLLRIAKERRSR